MAFKPTMLLRKVCDAILKTAASPAWTYQAHCMQSRAPEVLVQAARRELSERADLRETWWGEFIAPAFSLDRWVDVRNLSLAELPLSAGPRTLWGRAINGQSMPV
eukprot:4036575-Pyramimonas_sp.AAC.1